MTASAEQLAKAKQLGDLLRALAQADPEASPLDRRARPSIDEAGDLILIDLRIGRLIVKTATGTVHRLKSYGKPLRPVAYPNLDAAIAAHQERLAALQKGEPVGPPPGTSGWRIEEAKTGRSTCRVCSRAIDAGTLRFGQDAKNATWFHLGCAAQGAPRAFKPFHAQAERLLSAAPRAPANESRGRGAQQLGAAVRADPHDAQARAVYADWLQEQGDPWGKLIALESAGARKQAAVHFAAHARDLSGGFGLRLLSWKNGFMHRAELEGRNAAAVGKQLEALMATRTAVALDTLVLAVRPDAALMASLSRLAPTLRELTVHAGPGLEALALPRLERLRLFVREVPRGLDGLLAAKLPALRLLSVLGKRGAQGELGARDVLPLDFLRKLLGSTLLRQLSLLELDFGAVDEAGARLVVENAKALAHLEGVSIASGFGPLAKLARRAFGRRQAAWDRHARRWAAEEKSTQRYR